MRLMLILLLAIGLNLGLFLIMDSMVSTGSMRTVELMDVEPVEFVRTVVDEETRSRDRRTPPPPKPREIARPQAQVTDIAQRATALDVSSSYEISSLLGEGGGAAIAQNVLASSVGDFDVLMANDLVPISMLPPQFPPAARARGIEGWVDVIFVVSTRGDVEEAWVVESEPPEMFDQAAIDAAMRWRFRPVTENGEAVPAERIIRINFSLERGL